MNKDYVLLRWLIQGKFVSVMNVLVCESVCFARLSDCLLVDVHLRSGLL